MTWRSRGRGRASRCTVPTSSGRSSCTSRAPTTSPTRRWWRCCAQLGISPAAITAGLSNFVGAPRRFELRGSWRGVDVYESYAHLPGEIAAILAATRAAGYERVTAVFQPHRVTRTLAFADEFAPAFDGASHVIVTDIYTAGEANPSGVTGELIVRAITSMRRGRHALLRGPGRGTGGARIAARPQRRRGGAGRRRRRLGGDTLAGPDLMSLEELVAVGGARVREHEPFGPRTTYRVGGSARVRDARDPRDLDELGPLMLRERSRVVRARQWLESADRRRRARGPRRAPRRRIRGVRTRDEGDVVVVDAGAGLDLPIAARRLAKDGVIGFEWAVGVPGTFGGAVAMNAGGHGEDMNDSLVVGHVWHDGVTRTWSKERLELGYRTSAIGATTW